MEPVLGKKLQLWLPVMIDFQSDLCAIGYSIRYDFLQLIALVAQLNLEK